MAKMELANNHSHLREAILMARFIANLMIKTQGMTKVILTNCQAKMFSFVYNLSHGTRQ